MFTNISDPGTAQLCETINQELRHEQAGGRHDRLDNYYVMSWCWMLGMVSDHGCHLLSSWQVMTAAAATALHLGLWNGKLPQAQKRHYKNRSRHFACLPFVSRFETWRAVWNLICLTSLCSRFLKSLILIHIFYSTLIRKGIRDFLKILIRSRIQKYKLNFSWLDCVMHCYEILN